MWALSIAIGVAPGCEEKKTGGLMLAIQTDMAAPKDVDEVGLYITSDGRPIFTDTRQVAPNGEVKFPATLAILGSDDRAQAAIRIRTVAFQKTKARVLRDVVTTAPTSRVALMRVPLQWLSDGSVSGSSTDLVDAFRQLQSVCPDGQTSIAGECASAVVDSNKLPDYEPTEVFGGGGPEGNGQCFEVNDCFAADASATPDLATCTLSGRPVTDSTNIALVVNNAGECGKDKSEVCTSGLVALNRGGEGGWSDKNGQIALPASVCRKLQERTIQGLLVSTRCPSKTERNPVCSKASVVSGGSTAGTQGGGGPPIDGFPDGGFDVLNPNPDFKKPVNATSLSEPFPMGIAVGSAFAYAGRQGAPSGNPGFGVVRFRADDGSGFGPLWEKASEPRNASAYWRIAVQPNAAYGIAVEGTSNTGIIFLTTEAAPQPTPFTLQPGVDAVAASDSHAYWSFQDNNNAPRIVTTPLAAPSPVTQPAAPFAERITTLHWSANYLYGGTDKGRVFRCATSGSVPNCDSPATYEQLYVPQGGDTDCLVSGITTFGQGGSGFVYWTSLNTTPAAPPACAGVWGRPLVAGATAVRYRGGDVFSDGPVSEVPPRPPGAIAADARYIYFFSFSSMPYSIKRDGSGDRRYRMDESLESGFVSGIAVTQNSVLWTVYNAGSGSRGNMRRADKLTPF